MAHRKRSTGRTFDSGLFVPFSREILCSDEFASLSPWAVKLLLFIASQYNLRNNGDLSATWKQLQRKGWKSRATMGKALRELRDANWIALMRQGGKHRCNLYALTFYDLDPSPKHSEPTCSFRRSAWRRDRRLAVSVPPKSHSPRASAVPTDTPSVPVSKPVDALTLQ